MKIIQDIILNSFQMYKDNIAIIDENNNKIKYLDIEYEVYSIVENLVQLGLKEHDQYILIFNNRVNYIFNILAVLFLRGVFIPIDPNLPKGKINNMINECNANVIISDIDTFTDYDYKEIAIKNLRYSYNYYEIKVKRKLKLRYDYNITDFIYIYFTSGSTGIPKGIYGINASLVHFIDWEINRFNINESYRFAQLTSPSFDPFLRDIFVPLFSGGTICLLPKNGIINNINFLHEWIYKRKIAAIHCIPALFHILLFHICKYKTVLSDLNYIFLAGEQVSINDIEIWFKINLSKTKLINLYGPTETTLAKLFHEITIRDLMHRVIPIGKPLPDTNVYLLNENNERDRYGEICIETPYCTGGYINNEVNNGKYINSPFNPKLKMFRTGDLGEFINDNDLVYKGRIDRQIKIYGISINLYEIEQHIIKVSNIDQCLVVKDKHNCHLKCFYVSKDDINYKEINKQLLNFYQNVFLPFKYIKINELCRNENGKVNYKNYESI